MVFWITLCERKVFLTPDRTCTKGERHAAVKIKHLCRTFADALAADWITARP